MANVNLVQNIVGSWSTSDVRIANLSDTQNMFIETQGEGASATHLIRSIRGSRSLCKLSDRPCRGLFEASRGSDGFAVLFAVFANELYVIRNVNGSYVGHLIYSSLTNVDTPVSMCETGGEGSSHPHLVVVDGSSVIAVDTTLSNGEMIDDIRSIALPYRVDSTSVRIVPTHVAYCYNYLLVNDAGTDAFYTSYQYPFERTYTKESGAESFVQSIKSGLGKVVDNEAMTQLIEKINAQLSDVDIDLLIVEVKNNVSFSVAQQEQIVSLLEDLKSYELWKLTAPGKEGNIDYDIFMVNPWRAVEVSYKDYGFVTYSEWSPDNTTSLISNGTLLYTFGPKSTQIFQHQDSVDAPFVSPTNCANDIGIKAEHSVARNGDYVFYLGSSNIGENGVYQWQSNQLTKVSTPDVERRISQMKNVTDARGQCWTENGHMFYAISFIDGDATFVYDILERQWHRRSSKDANSDEQHVWRLQWALLHDSMLCYGTSDGHIVKLDDVYDEYDGRPIIRLRRSGMLMNNYQDFFVDGIRLICNSGDFDNSSLTPHVMMRYSDSGGAWSNQELGLMGKQGRYDYELEWFNLGLHNVMCIEFSCSDPVNFVMLNGKIQYTLCDAF